MKISRFTGILTGILLVSLFFTAMLSALPVLFGIKTFIVRSSSMEPAVRAGSLAYVKKVLPEDISPGDIVVYTASGSLTTTHRVMEINLEDRYFIAKGDANGSADSPESFDNLIGRVVFSLPYAGFVTSVMKSRAGIGAFALVALLLLVSSFFPAKRKG